MKKIIYLIILLLTTFIIAVNLFYYKPYYIQLIVTLGFSTIGLLISYFIPRKFTAMIYIVIFITLIFTSVSVYKSYAKNINDYCTTPLFTQLKKEINTTGFEGGFNPLYYKDSQFEGLISFDQYKLYLFDFTTN